MKKFLLLAFILAASHLSAQLDTSRINEKSSFKSHLVGGGSIGLSFGNITTIGLSPIVGYKFTDKLIAGVGGSYFYTKYHFPGYVPFSTYVYGGSIWGRYIFLPQLFLAAEAEELNSVWDPYVRPDYRSFRNSYLGGLGYRNFNGYVSNYIEVLYNFNRIESAYDSPIVLRAGIAFGM